MVRCLDLIKQTAVCCAVAVRLCVWLLIRHAVLQRCFRGVSLWPFTRSTPLLRICVLHPILGNAAAVPKNANQQLLHMHALVHRPARATAPHTSIASALMIADDPFRVRFCPHAL